MNNHNYTSTVLVDQTPKEAFDAINNPRAWWASLWSGEIEGNTDKPGAEFTYRVRGVHYCKMKITEFIPGKKVVWHVLDSCIDYTKAKTEWNDTNICFEISRKKGKTEVRSTHIGLVPVDECYDSCSNARGTLINGSLRSLITKGNAQPNLKEQ